MKIQRILAPALLTAILASGCQAPTESPSSELQERIAVLEQKVAVLEKRGLSGENPVESTVSAEASSETPPSSEVSRETASPTPAVEASGTPSPASSERLVEIANFSDFPSPQRLKELVSFGFLSKAEVTSPEDLEGEITRGQYVAMIVEMNNFMFDTDSGKNIRLARDSASTFTDVPTDHPYYKYIQGMVDAGYVIGFDEETFKPDKTLSREEMIAIASKRDYRKLSKNVDYQWKTYANWTDKEEIAPKYRRIIAFDMSRGANSNLKQAFGDAKLLKPKQAVRCYEAVLSLYKVGNHGSYQYKKKVKETLGGE